MLVLAACGSSTHRAGSSSSSSSPISPGGNPTAPAADATTAHEVPLPAPLKRTAKATLILDFTPNAVHAGIYRALAAGYYRKENIDLSVVPPSSTSSTLSLIAAGRA